MIPYMIKYISLVNPVPTQEGSKKSVFDILLLLVFYF